MAMTDVMSSLLALHLFLLKALTGPELVRLVELHLLLEVVSALAPAQAVLLPLSSISLTL
jgi:hypothetical protein